MGGNMFGFEIKKYLQNKMIVFIVIGMMILKALVSYFSLNISVPFSEVVYESYLVTWDGKLNDIKSNEIEEENLRLEYIISNYSILEEQYHNGEIEFEEFYECAKAHDKAKTEQDAFLPVYAKYQYYQTTNEEVEFFYDLEIMELVSLFKRDIILMLLLCIIISVVSDIDINGDMYSVIKSQPKGRKEFTLTKLAGVVFVSAIMTTLFIGLDVVVYGLRYSFENWNRTIYSIQKLSSFPVNIPVWGYFGIISLIKVLFTSVISILIFLINKFSKKLFLAIFISVVVFVLFSLVI